VKQFVLVFSESACVWMLAHKFQLVNEDKVNGFWVFVNREDFESLVPPFGYSYSDILTFNQ
jgi:hypothetical protein